MPEKPQINLSVAQFQRAARKSAGTAYVRRPRVQKIAFVGASLNGWQRLDELDSFFLDRTFEFFSRTGIRVAKSVDVLVADTKLGHDILDPKFAIKADAIVCCLITNPDKAFVGENGVRWDERRIRNIEKQSPLYTSPLHSPEAWREIAPRNGAWAVISFSSGVQIDGDDLNRPGFIKTAPASVVIGEDHGFSYKEYMMDVVMREDVAKLTNLPAAAPPMPA